jgi:uncharacterized protein YdhG (YjbR/CyaY superfamily)
MLTSGPSRCAATLPSAFIFSGGLTKCAISRMIMSMESNKVSFQSIDEYIATFPEDIRVKLEELRATIKAAAPGAVEKISYQMPAFALKGNLVYFAAFKNHIGFFPGSVASVMQAFKSEASLYQTGKGTLQFPLEKPMPLELVSKIVKYRVAENLKKAEIKAAKKKK